MNAYYPDYDVLSCAQHVEAKRLANKFWTQWNNLSDRIANEPANLKLHEKSDKIYNQFKQTTRGLLKCCTKH